jgi:hypothetical protein
LTLQGIGAVHSREYVAWRQTLHPRKKKEILPSEGRVDRGDAAAPKNQTYLRGDKNGVDVPDDWVRRVRLSREPDLVQRNA